MDSPLVLMDFGPLSLIHSVVCRDKLSVLFNEFTVDECGRFCLLMVAKEAAVACSFCIFAKH